MARPSTGSVRLLTGSREPVRAATTQNITLSGLQTIDGVALGVGDRVLVKNQQNGVQNGIYTASEGPWYRAPDARDRQTLTTGVTVHIQQGTSHGGQSWRVTSLKPRVGTDEVNFAFYLSATFSEDAAAIIAGQLAALEGAGESILLPLVQQAEAAKAAAESAAGANLAAMPSRSAALIANIPASVSYVRTAGYLSAGDNGEGLYRRAGSQPSHPGKFQSADGAWWELTGRVVRAEVFGVVANNSDQSTNLQAALDYLAATGGGTLLLPNGQMKASGLVVSSQAINIIGCARTSGSGAGTRLNPVSTDGPILTYSSRGGILSNILFSGNSIHASGILLVLGASLITLQGVYIDGGYNNLSILTGANIIRFFDCRFTNAFGEHNLKINHMSNIHHFVGVQFSSTGQATSIVFEGRCGSTTFLACNINFGKHGVACYPRADIGPNEIPGNIYWIGNGMENIKGSAFHCVAVGSLRITGGYFSGGASVHGVYLGPLCTGPIRLSACDVRGFGRSGVYNDSPATVVIGGASAIVNTCSKALKGVVKPVTGVVNNGAGACRITIVGHGFSGTITDFEVQAVGGVPAVNGFWETGTVIDANTIDIPDSVFSGAYTTAGVFSTYGNMSVQSAYSGAAGRIRVQFKAAHGLRTGDSIQIVDVAGSTEANGIWEVVRIDDVRVDLVGSTYVANSTANTGQAWFEGANVHLTSGATGANIISGNALGGDSSGARRMRWAVRMDSSKNVIAGNDVGNLSSGQPEILDTTTDARNVVRDNRGDFSDQIDGYLNLYLPGTLANGQVNIGMVLGEEIFPVTATARLSVGTATISLRDDAAATLATGMSADQTAKAFTSVVRRVIDARTTPKNIVASIASVASGAAGLHVVIGYCKGRRH